MWNATMIKRTVCLKTVAQAARLKTLYFKNPTVPLGTSEAHSSTFVLSQRSVKGKGIDN